MSVEPGDMFEHLSRSSTKDIFVIVQKKPYSYGKAWTTFNVTQQRYEWDEEKTLLNPTTYRRLV